MVWYGMVWYVKLTSIVGREYMDWCIGGYDTHTVSSWPQPFAGTGGSLGVGSKPLEKLVSDTLTGAENPVCPWKQLWLISLDKH